MNIGILASHEGTTAQAIIDACSSAEFPAKVSVVISNNHGAKVLSRASDANIPIYNLSGKTHPDLNDLDHAICQTLLAHEVDLVFLAGYLKKVGPITLEQFHNRILNTHPALLPKFGGQGMYGRRVHEAVLKAKEPISGVSIHLVESEYDTGTLIAQRTVPVEHGDTAETLARRIHHCEHNFVVEVLKDIANGKRILPAAIELRGKANDETTTPDRD